MGISVGLGDAISATDLARNLASTIDKVRLSRRSVRIVKGNQTIAQLSPAMQEGFPMTQLENFFLNLPHLDHEEAQSFGADLKMIREGALLPDESPWE